MEKGEMCKVEKGKNEEKGGGGGKPREKDGRRGKRGENGETKVERGEKDGIAIFNFIFERYISALRSYLYIYKHINEHVKKIIFNYIYPFKSISIVFSLMSFSVDVNRKKNVRFVKTTVRFV